MFPFIFEEKNIYLFALISLRSPSFSRRKGRR